MGHGVFAKLRFDRAVLRWWLLALGLLLIDPSWPRFWIGSAMVWLAACLHLLSKAYLSQNEELARTGPYRFTRNPFYLANLIAECGLLLIIGRWWFAALYLIVWFIIYGRQINSEERKLTQLFGEQFAAYRHAVPRLFPLPWRIGRHPGSSFSVRNHNIVAERAVERSVRLASYPLLLMAVGLVEDSGWSAVNGPNDNALWLFAAFLAVLGVATVSSVVMPRLLPHEAPAA